MAPRMRDVFLMREAKISMLASDAAVMVDLLHSTDDVVNQAGERADWEYPDLTPEMQAYASKIEKALTDIGFKRYSDPRPNDRIEIDAPPQSIKTALLGVLANNDSHGYVGSKMAARIKKDIGDLGMPAKTAHDVNADPHAPASAKVAADRELEKEK